MKAKVCLNTVTIRGAALEEKIEAAREGGYEGIGLWREEVEKFAAGGRSLADLRRMVEGNGLVAAEICFVGGWQWAVGEARAKAFDSAKETFEMAQGLGCGVVCALPSNGRGDLALAAEEYGELCDLAGEYGVCPALEFIGPFEQVKDVATAWETVKGANRANGGILLDTFHFVRGGSRLEDLEALPEGAVSLVHINDAPEKRIEELTDADRVMPGEGFFPLGKILGSLARKGYEGFLSLELFNRELWEKDACAVAKLGGEALRRVVARV